MCIKDGINKTEESVEDILNYLHSCNDLTDNEVESIKDRTDSVEKEFVECIGNDVDSYWEYTCMDKEGFPVAVFEVYPCRDYVNLLEYDELIR